MFGMKYSNLDNVQIVEETDDMVVRNLLTGCERDSLKR